MIDELIRDIADSFAKERSEDARLEICITVFGREHLMMESFSVRLAKALAVPHVATDGGSSPRLPGWEYEDPASGRVYGVPRPPAPKPQIITTG